MLKLLKLLVYIPVAVLLIAFAVANHEFVTVSLDPFSNRADAALSFDAPMFVVIIVSVMVGVIAGGLVVWIGQGRHRRAARQLRGETERLKAHRQVVEPQSLTKLARRA